MGSTTHAEYDQSFAPSTLRFALRYSLNHAEIHCWGILKPCCIGIASTASCPTSFEGKYGRIIYRVRAIIDTPRFVTDYNTETFFYLLNVLNLNELPDIWVSYDDVYNEVKHFSAVMIFNVPINMLPC